MWNCVLHHSSQNQKWFDTLISTLDFRDLFNAWDNCHKHQIRYRGYAKQLWNKFRWDTVRNWECRSRKMFIAHILLDFKSTHKPSQVTLKVPIKTNWTLITDPYIHVLWFHFQHKWMYMYMYKIKWHFLKSLDRLLVSAIISGTELVSRYPFWAILLRLNASFDL